MAQLIECVPNFSEGRDMGIIKQITDQIVSVDGVKLLDVDPGKATNRTVVTFVGEPDAVLDAAVLAVRKAGELIDMSKHSGEHPRFGATDVCPLVPIANISMEETAEYAKKLGARIGEEVGIPVYLYEKAASSPERVNLATVRSGEYEGLPEKLADPNWKPDFGPAAYSDEVARTGVTAVSARNFLVAYNVNLNTTSTRKANSVAFDVREAGRVKRKGDPITGEIVKDKDGNAERVPGMLKACKAIGWYIEEYGVAQISINLTDISITAVHEAFDAVAESAQNRGMRATGSELVGLIPKQAMLDAGKHYLTKQQRSLGVDDAELIKIAIKSMGLDELSEFDPKKKIIEYVMADATAAPLANMTIAGFADETASESPAPGGGSISAYLGALGVSLATMVANLSSHKRGWDDRWEEFSVWAEKGQALKDKLITAVDEDTEAFNRIMAAFGLPKGTDEEAAARKKGIEDATKYAIDVPFSVMETVLESMEVIKAMADIGNPNSASDAGVGALCARSAVMGAYLNVRINAGGLEDKAFGEDKIKAGAAIVEQAQKLESEILELVEKNL
jgi:glutamate formiminotransferase/formiminotetrahydrofolate cyclodeaminase